MELIYFAPMISITFIMLLFVTGKWRNEILLTFNLIIYTVCLILLQNGYIYEAIHASLYCYGILTLIGILRKRKDDYEEK